MSFNSVIEQSIIQAYLETHYCVAGLSPFVIYIGKVSQPLAKLQLESNVNCSAFITAYNPFSKKLDDEANADLQLELASELRKCNLSFIEGIGKHPNCNWPGEPSYLVLGLPLLEARALGIKCEQNAIVWIGPTALPELILLR